MNDQVLDILKLAFLGLLYLFFARVLWSVWSEVRTDQRPVERTVAPAPGAATPPTTDTTKPLSRREQRQQERRSAKRVTARRGVPTKLVTLEPHERKGTAIALTGTVTIGRDADNSLVLADDFVSTHHARIARTDDAVVLHDLGSRNGTVVNGSRVTGQRQLRTGDRIQIGYTLLEAQ